MLVTTEAIVLRSRKQGDSSKICALYTKEYGLVDVIAKGAREMKSKFAGALELFSHITAVFYKKQGRELYLLAKAEALGKTKGITDSLERIEAATLISELLLNSLHDEEENPALFDLLRDVLQSISVLPARADNAPLVFSFYLAFAGLNGFALHLPKEIPEGKSAIFDVEKGNVVFTDAAKDTNGNDSFAPLSGEAFSALRYLSAGSDPLSLRLSERARHSLERLFRSYFARHLEGMQTKRSKSAGVFARMEKK
jgi:DNA repair protein RecO (recombination protein O)